MSEEQAAQPQHNSEDNSNVIYYVIGAVLLVVVIGAGYLLKTKSMPTDDTSTQAQPVSQEQVQQPVNKGPITKLGCEKQYYNPVVGLPKYYLGAEGVDLPGTTSVNCIFSVVVNKEVVATDTVPGTISNNLDRNGVNFVCATKQLALPAQVPAKVDVTLTNDKDTSASCTATFLLPRP